MTVRKAYSTLSFPWCMNFNMVRNLFFLIIFCFTLSTATLFGQKDYDEISVFLEVPGVGAGEIAAVIEGQEVYLPVTDLFDFLKIKNTPSQEFQSVSGFFISPGATYEISKTNNEIRYQDKVYNLEKGDLITTESNLYLKSSYFGKVFGLDCSFNFRALSVKVNSKLELPLIREMRQEEMRKNLTRIKGGIIADSTVRRTYPLFKFGMADWSAISTEEINGKTEARLNLSLGAMIAGGEANASLNYNSLDPFSEKQQYYQWRYVNNDWGPLKQIMAGKIASNPISSIYNPVVGVQFTNTPTTYRRSFGSYTLSDKTEPDWVVELYVNNELVDYVKADASGFYTFQVPLVYGNSIIRLKFFGPWGEERTLEQYINIPFNFLPEKTMEYTISAGIVEDSSGSRYSKADFKYGVSRSLTAGAGVEYLSSIISNPAIPYVNASLRITNNLLLTGEYAFGVRTKGNLTFRLPSNLQLDLNYTWYDKDQKAINYNYREERKAVLSMPLRLGKMTSYQRFSYYQIVLPTSKFTTAEWLFSGGLAGVSTNLTTYALFVDHTRPYLYSNLSLAFRLPAGLVLIPQAQYGYSQNKMISAKASIEKHLLKNGFLNMSYERVFINNIAATELGFRYDFSFAQTGASVRQSDHKTSLIQYARGSLINDTKTKYLSADNRTNVGKGGITIMPFLDLNSNGKRDHGEPRAYGLNVHAGAGRIEKNDRDSTIRILDLEPYTNCFVELDPNSFNDVAWRLPKQTLNVAIDPNILKLIEIPVTVAGEANGNVLLEKDNEKVGLARIMVDFHGAKHNRTEKTLTETDGYFSYFGLAPGKYTVSIDTVQLRKLNMTSNPVSIDVNVSAQIDGDIIKGLDFILRKKAKDSVIVKTTTPAMPVILKDTSTLIVHEISRELVTISEDSYALQMAAFKKKEFAEIYRKRIEKILGKPLEIVSEDGFYKVRLSDIKERKDVDADIAILHQNGINEVWVINFKAKHQQWVLKENQDTITKITEKNISNPVLAISPEMLVQLGSFREKSRAIELRDRVSLTTTKKVTIVFENGFYKVKIENIPLIDQTIIEEMKKHEPSIGKLKNTWIAPFRKLTEEELPVIEKEPVVERQVISVNHVLFNKPVPPFAKSQNKLILTESKLVKTSIPHEPTISLLVLVCHDKSDALRAQRRIKSKLKLPVEIVKEYEYYHVTIPGFFTREETYKYYPELAGLGYPGARLIEVK